MTGVQTCALPISQPRRTAPRRSGPGNRRGAVSWQELVPSVLDSPAPFELVAAARLACAWLLEGEKEEGGTEEWGKGKKSSLELYLCFLGASDSAARELLSQLFPFRVHREEKVSATQPRRALRQVCTAAEARSARKQMLLPRLQWRRPAPGLCNCHTAPEVNLTRE